MYIKTFAFAALALSVTSTSCGVFKTKRKGKKATEQPAELVGEWHTDCFKVNDYDPPNVIEKYTFSAIGDFDKVTILHSDENCKDEALNFKVTGTYGAKGTLEGNEDIKKLNLTVDAVFVKPESQAMAGSLNDHTYCGIGDWQKDQEENVVGRECHGETFKKGDVIYEVYAIKGKELYFGHSFGFFIDTGKERPSEINLEKDYHKQ